MKAKKLKARIALVLMALTLLASPLLSVSIGAEETPTLSVGSAPAVAGEVVSVDVTVSGNPGVCCMILDVDYDEDALALSKVELNSDMGGMLEYGSRIVWLGMGGDTTYNGKFMTLTFTVLGDASAADQTVSISYKDGDICNYDEESVDFDLVDGTISIVSDKNSAEANTAGNSDGLTSDAAVSANGSDEQSKSGASDTGANSEDGGKSQSSSGDISANDQDSSGPDTRPIMIAVVVLIVLIAVGTCVFAIVKNKKDGETK